MRHIFALISAVVIFAVSCTAQNVMPDKPLVVRHNDLGLSMVVPVGWHSVTETVPEPSALLKMEPDANTVSDNTSVVVERKPTDGLSGSNTEIGKQYVERTARATKGSVTLKPIRILLGGIDFYRMDVWVKPQSTHVALLAVGRKGAVIAISVSSTSRRGVDDAVGKLVGAVYFSPDWTLPDSELDKSKYRIRVSMGVSEGLLLKKVAPIYPEEAKQAKKWRGEVVLGATISRSGDVQRLWVSEGDPLFIPAAIDAVRQWKYRPYLLNRQPVIVETTIAVTVERH